jgi:hypothetical protein
MATFDIPEHWSTEQALAVCDLLEDLHHTIWDQYEERLIELILSQIQREDALANPETPETAIPFDDDLPF